MASDKLYWNTLKPHWAYLSIDYSPFLAPNSNELATKITCLNPEFLGESQLSLVLQE